LRDIIIKRYKIKVNITNIIEENFYKKLTLTVQGSRKGSRKVITFD
jgi:hypothetical protein